jgi:eukaryotic-like serine/threonine-protein kinase
MTSQSMNRAGARPSITCVAAGFAAQNHKWMNPTMMVGRRAPEFTIPCTRGLGTERQFRIADCEDRWLMLLFYPRDFTLVCPTELTAVSARIAEFENRDCDVLAISTDSIATHERWLATPPSQGGLSGLNFPLGSDESGEMCKSYGVYVPKQHVALRGLFVVDPNGVLQYQVVHNLSVGRSTDEILRVLDGLQTGGLCPADWERGKAPIDLSQTLAPNHVLGSYQIEATIGSGSFGTVFRARDLVLERTVALKVSKSGRATSADSALGEARAAAALSHPNICVIHALEEQEGTPVIVMEYLDGQPLSNLLVGEPLDINRAAKLGRQIARGMAAAHAHQIVHGDLKPANIMVMADDHAKVLDFGLARQPVRSSSADETLEWSPVDQRTLSGTPRFMAPEQTRGEEVRPPSDVFALGLILYEMVTGRKAINDGPLLEVLQRINQVDPSRYAADVPEPFAAVLLQALVSEPASRQITMSEIASALG